MKCYQMLTFLVNINMNCFPYIPCAVNKQIGIQTVPFLVIAFSILMTSMFDKAGIFVEE